VQGKQINPTPSAPQNPYFLRSMNRKLLALAPAFGLLLCVLAPIQAPAQESPGGALKAVSKRSPAPNWELTGLDGNKMKLSDLKGQVVLLNFWATWCPPCRKEIPDLIQLQDKYKSQGFTVIGISVDEQGARVVKPFSTQLKMNYPILLATSEVAEAYRIDGIPASFLIDREGRLASTHIGFTERLVFESEIVNLLAEKK
jgi:thiol-disulfide isomerase/thioredoxin